MPNISEEDALFMKRSMGNQMTDEEEAKLRRAELAKKLADKNQGMGQKGLLAMGGYGKK